MRLYAVVFGGDFIVRLLERRQDHDDVVGEMLSDEPDWAGSVHVWEVEMSSEGVEVVDV